MELTEDSWRALARSSPWRWRTAHFTRTDDEGTVTAWVRRPGELLVRDDEGRTTYEHGLPCSSSTVVAFVADDGSEPPEPFRSRLPHEVVPALRPDGLVEHRPDRVFVDYDDPMYGDFTWVAMLDPVELSEGTEVEGLRADRVAGREVWRAVVRAAEEYDPRCPCCPLLWSVISDEEEYGERGNPHVDPADYPEAYEVALDVGTGVVVSLRPVGGRRDDLAFTVDLLAVDSPVDEVFAGR